MGHPVFEVIVGSLHLGSSAVVLDLGCGRGPAIHEVLARHPDARVTGLDANERSIAELAEQALPGVDAEIGDLNHPLRYASGTFDGVMSHNVIECLANPSLLLDEIARVLRPSGRAVLSHVDFDGIVIGGGDRNLTRTVLHAYSDHPPTFLTTADGQIGRQLPGLVKRSPLELVDVSVHTTVSHRLDGDARARVEEIAGAVQADAAGLSGADLEAWVTSLTEADEDGAFFFAEPCVVVTASHT